MVKFCLCTFLFLNFVFQTQAQTTAINDSVTIAANADLDQGPIHKFLFGKHYRPLWATPVTIKILDLENSGFEIIKEGGSRETFNIRLTDSLGRQYVARSVKKDLTKALPHHLQKTVIGRVFTDLMSANHPYGPLMVPPLANAADILHSHPRLFVIRITDKTGNGFKSDSTSMIVLLEERPDETWQNFPNYNYSKKIVSTESFLDERLNTNTVHTDAGLFLRNRLLDMLIGDWSRHEDQYRWAIADSNGTKIYQPVPRDRDHAFYKFNDGLLNQMSLLMIPKTVTFGRRIKSVKHLYVVGKLLGKLILPQLSKDEWNKNLQLFKNNLTDSVIENAVKQLPPEIYTRHGKKCISFLKSRRNQLPRVSEKLYQLIFTRPNIIGSNEHEIFYVNRINKEETLVEVFRSADGDSRELIYRRKFNSDETREISLFGLEGNDRFIVSGVKNGIKIRLLAGPGEDLIEKDDRMKRISVNDSHDYDFTQTILKQQLH